MTNELVPLHELGDHLEAQAHRWEVNHTPHSDTGECAFRDGAVSGYRWARRLLLAALEAEND